MLITLIAADNRWVLDLHIREIDVTTHEERIRRSVLGAPSYDLHLGSFDDVVAALRAIDPAITGELLRTLIHAKSAAAIQAATSGGT